MCLYDFARFADMSKKKEQESAGAWVLQGVPRDLMRRMKIAAAIEEKTLKQLVFEVCEGYLRDLEKKGILPK